MANRLCSGLRSEDFNMKLFKLLIILIGSIGLIACNNKSEINQSETPVTLFQLPDNQNQLNRTFNGIAKAHDLVELAFRVDGKIDNILVSKGQRVTKGQLLAVLDKSDYQVTVDAYKSKVDRTYKQYKRGEQMLKKALMAQAEFDTMKAEYLVAKADYKQSQLYLEYTELKAPFNGIIGDTFLDSFENVTPGTPVLSLHKFDLIEIEVQIPDHILAISKRQGDAGPTFKVVFSAYPEIPFEGKVYEINLVKDPVTRTYLALLTVEMNERYKILQGMPAKVSVDLEQATYSTQREYLIPISAVRSIDGDSLDKQLAHVFIYDKESQMVTATKVELGTIVDQFIEVKSGLNSGDSIVVDGSARLVDGQQVQLSKDIK